MRRPRLAITAGDPAGIGPEIIVKALSRKPVVDVDLAVVGPASVLEDAADRCALPRVESLGFEIVDIPLDGPLVTGQVSVAGGHAAARAVLLAAQRVMAGEFDGLVTAPLHKESLRAAGYPWPGHTEMLAEAAGVTDFAMMFVGGPLRVVLLTIHLPLAAVPGAVTSAEVRRVVELLHRELPRFGALRRRIAVCGVNPHAGEGGLFGREDLERVAPAVEELRRNGLDVEGPLPADSVFVRAVRGEFDAVVAAYHDQGLIPVKLLAFGESVNVTLGLPFVRTSVDHGTAFDIAGRGIADESSLLAALRLAAQLVRQELPQTNP